MTLHPRDGALPLARGRWSLGFMALLAGVTALAPFSLPIFLPADRRFLSHPDIFGRRRLIGLG